MERQNYLKPVAEGSISRIESTLTIFIVCFSNIWTRHTSERLAT
jgi:hypothetical protein